MSTLRVTTIEAKADGSSPSVNEKVKITNSSGDVMLQLDGATSGITTVGINTTDPAFTVDANRNFEFVGVVTASSFSGNVNAGVVTATSSIVVGNSFINSTSIGIGTTDTAGRNAGVGTAVGTIIYNITSDEFQGYGPNGWVTIKKAVLIAATGGTQSTNATETIHTFTSPGTFSVTSGSGNIKVLVVAGGGAGGYGGGQWGGGGGAGAIRYGESFAVTPGPYSVTIGGGGSPGSYNGGNGSNSVFGPLTAVGGGGGGSNRPGYSNPQRDGQAGGCGGGSGENGIGGTGSGDPGGSPNSESPTNGWGNDGGSNDAGNATGGGGGAGTPGGQGTSSQPGGFGGDGLAFNISGSAVTYAGGGGGSWWNTGTGTNGGPGGGGPGGQLPNGDGDNGTANTGGGGGGTSSGNAGSGGSGIVIVSYPNT